MSQLTPCPLPGSRRLPKEQPWGLCSAQQGQEPSQVSQHSPPSLGQIHISFLQNPPSAEKGAQILHAGVIMETDTSPRRGHLQGHALTPRPPCLIYSRYSPVVKQMKISGFLLRQLTCVQGVLKLLAGLHLSRNARTFITDPRTHQSLTYRPPGIVRWRCCSM